MKIFSNCHRWNIVCDGMKGVRGNYLSTFGSNSNLSNTCDFSSSSRFQRKGCDNIDELKQCMGSEIFSLNSRMREEGGGTFLRILICRSTDN